MTEPGKQGVVESTVRPRLSPRSLLSRPYAVPAEPFEVETTDGVAIRGHRLGSGSSALVFTHGFLGWHRKARLVGFQEQLARWFQVFAFDLRGHGDSGGLSGFGAWEHLDVDAVVRLARSRGAHSVVAFGGSMGGIAVIAHAARLGGVDAVVAVSTPARWDGHDSIAVRRLAWLTGTPSGRRILRALGVRATPVWERTEEPADLVARIAPTPLLLVHGADDHFFDVEEAWLLYRRAGQPKRLLLASRFGHAEDGYGPGFARRIAAAIDQMLPDGVGAEAKTAPREQRRAAG